MGVLDTPLYPTQQMIAGSSTPPTMTVWDDGTYVHARMYYGVVGGFDYDLHIRWLRTNTIAGQNGNLGMYQAILVKSVDRIGDVSTSNISFAVSTTDDIGPIGLSGRGNSAGNHTFEGCLLTKTAHGITSTSIGKRWVDFAGRNWRLLSVPTVNTLFFAAQADGSGYTRTTISTGGTLTSLDAQPNVATAFTVGIVQSGDTSNYMVSPTGGWIRDRVLSILADGVELQPYEFKFGVRELVLRDKYNVPRHDNVYTEMTTTTPDLRTVTAGFSVTREFRVYGWAQVSCVEGLRVIGGNWSLTVDSLPQANRMTSVGSYTNLWRWIPGAHATGPGGFNLSAPALHNTAPTGDPCWLMPTHVADTNYCPDGFLEFLTTSSASLTAATALIGQWISMDPLTGEGSIASRLTNMAAAGGTIGYYRITTSTNKSYPNIKVTASGFENVNDSTRSVSHRRWFQPQSTGPIAQAYVKEIDGRFTVRCAWQAAHGIVSVSLPAWLNGRVVSVVYQTGGSLVSSRVVNNAITINCSSAVGHVILRLYPRNQ